MNRRADDTKRKTENVNLRSKHMRRSKWGRENYKNINKRSGSLKRNECIEGGEKFHCVYGVDTKIKAWGGRGGGNHVPNLDLS